MPASRKSSAAERANLTPGSSSPAGRAGPFEGEPEAAFQPAPGSVRKAPASDEHQVSRRTPAGAPIELPKPTLRSRSLNSPPNAPARHHSKTGRVRLAGKDEREHPAGAAPGSPVHHGSEVGRLAHPLPAPEALVRRHEEGDRPAGAPPAPGTRPRTSQTVRRRRPRRRRRASTRRPPGVLIRARKPCFLLRRRRFG